MRLKSELYAKEQKQLVHKIIQILYLDDEGSTTLYEIEQDQEKIDQIMNLSPKIRIFFSYQCIIGVRYPEKSLRPWLSIIRQVTKLEYKMISKDCRIKKDEQIIRSKRYWFVKKSPV